MLALPAEPGHRPERLFHHRRGIDEDLDVVLAQAPAAGLGDEPAGKLLQLALDDVVIVPVPGIDGDRAAIGPTQNGERVLVRTVIHGQDDNRAHVRP